MVGVRHSAVEEIIGREDLLCFQGKLAQLFFLTQLFFWYLKPMIYMFFIYVKSTPQTAWRPEMVVRHSEMWDRPTSFRSFFVHGSTRTDRTSQLVKLNSHDLHWTLRHFHLVCIYIYIYVYINLSIYIYTQQTHTKSTYARQRSRPRNGDPGDTPSHP